KVVTTAPGGFTVHSWRLCLVELVPDPRHEQFRFRIRVRHENSDVDGKVGVYVADAVFPGHSRTTNLFVGMVFNDVRPASDVIALAPPHLADKLPRPRSRVRLGAGVAGEREGGVAWEELPNGISGPPFDPRGVAGDTWRELELEVSAEAVLGTWNGQHVG